MTRPRPALDLALASGLVLFLELACIRWFPAHVLFLSFFTNTVLLACFVGMSVGCLVARKPTSHIRGTPYWLVAAVGCGLLVSAYHGKLERHLDVGGQANPDVVFFGTEGNSLKEVEFVVPVEAVAGAFYFLIAATMVGPGQELGRAFNRVEGRSRAYSLNLLGSLAGIAAFAGCSALSLPPVAWFAATALGIAYLFSRDAGPSADARALRSASRLNWGLLAFAVALTAITSGFFDRDGVTVWSPYYRVQVNWSDRIINTNLISHQVMTSRHGTSTAAYDLPHLFARETGRAPYRRVLIIGAGSGNDVSRALAWAPPDARIDAVEIDPVIREIGGEHHPDRPYDDPRVTTHLTDGRTFLRAAPAGEYDLVVFALVDSLVLHSGASNIRLESYLFTQEAFADVARTLRPDGTCAVYNFFRHGWIVARLRDQLRTAFGTDPVVLTDPPADWVNLNTFDSSFTAFFAGREEAVAPLRDKFARSGNAFWVPSNRSAARDTPGRFAADPPAGDGWVRLRAAAVEESAELPPATDDWPFLYVRRPTVPGQVWRGGVVVVTLSLAVWWLFRDRAERNSLSSPGSAADGGSSRHTPCAVASYGDHHSGAGIASDPLPGHGTRSVPATLVLRSFLLGAGFMLIETKAVVEMALLFGSTWVVNTVVFAAVLLMALAGNRFAAWRKPATLGPYYLGLAAALAVGMLVPVDLFLGWPRAGQIVVSCILAFAPVAFAGVIFAASFERSTAPDRMIGANVAGALLGGLAENASLLLGFRWLLLVAGGFYLISGLVGRGSCSHRRQPVAYNAGEVWGGRVPRSRVGRLVHRVWAPDAAAGRAAD